MSIECVRQLQTLVSKLQTRVDHLETWYSQLDGALKTVGFEGGLNGLVEAIDDFEPPTE